MFHLFYIFSKGMKKYAFNLMRPFPYSDFVDIFRRASTSGGVQYSGLKTLYKNRSKTA